MTANTMTQTTAGKSPCGCGGTSAAPPSCGCGGKCGGSGQCSCSCGSCQSQVYARPQFFAGQLLTEDDLQSLTDYVVGKNRLHNRFLFGDGVVCGLTVTCPPCETGHVVVNPGYALDCCGNDIVVTCPKELDINQMVRQLLLKQPGWDCGDPCADLEAVTQSEATQARANQTVAARAEKASSSGSSAKKHHSPPRHYCLYVDYCEQSSDPVAPYASNAACGQGACEPTRVQECYKFELRCPTKQPCESAVGDRIRSCMGDERTAERIVTDHDFLRRYLGSLEEGVRKIRQHPAPLVDEPFWAQTKQHTAALTELLESPESRAKLTEAGKLHAVPEQVLDVAGDVARVLRHPHAKALRKHELDLLERAESALKRAGESLNSDPVEQAAPAFLPRAHVVAMFDMTRELLAESKQLRDAAEGSKGFDSGFLESYSARLLMERVVFDGRIARAVLHSLVSLRDWLVARLEQPGGTHCALLCQVNSVSISSSGTTDPNESLANNLVNSGGILASAVREVARSCVCEALIPPCAPCEDTGVLLACLTVEDCKVTEICNLDRKFVLTGPNIRYWFPEICRTGKELEKWCCPSCDREHDPAPTLREFMPRTYEESLHAAFGSAPGFVGLALSTLIEPRVRRDADADSARAPLARNVSRWLADDGGLRETLQSGKATADLRMQLENSLAEIGALKREQVKLRERLSKVEARRTPGERQ